MGWGCAGRHFAVDESLAVRGFCVAMKYRMMDQIAPGRTSRGGADFKVMLILAMIAVGIYFAHAQHSSASGVENGAP